MGQIVTGGRAQDKIKEAILIFNRRRKGKRVDINHRVIDNPLAGLGGHPYSRAPSAHKGGQINRSHAVKMELYYRTLVISSQSTLYGSHAVSLSGLSSHRLNITLPILRHYFSPLWALSCVSRNKYPEPAHQSRLAGDTRRTSVVNASATRACNYSSILRCCDLAASGRVPPRRRLRACGRAGVT